MYSRSQQHCLCTEISHTDTLQEVLQEQGGRQRGLLADEADALNGWSLYCCRHHGRYPADPSASSLPGSLRGRQQSDGSSLRMITRNQRSETLEYIL